MRLGHLSIRSKLSAAFATLFIFIASLSAVGLWCMSEIDSKLVTLQTQRLPALEKAGEVDALTGRYNTSLLRHLLTTDAQKLAGVEKDLIGRDESLNKASLQYEQMIASPEEEKLYKAFSKNWRAFIESAQPLLALSRQGEKAQALALYETKSVPPRRAASIALENIVKFHQEESVRFVADSEATYIFAKQILIGFGLLSGVLAVMLAAVITRGIAGGIRSVVVPMQALAAGDLDVTIPHQGATTEIGMIADAVQVFKDSLIRMRAMENDAAEARRMSDEQRRGDMERVAAGFEAAVGGVIDTMSSSASHLQVTAQTMTETATSTAAQSTAAAAAAEQATSNVSVVAAAAEELGSSVQEIGRQAAGSAELALKAVGETDQAGAAIQELQGAVSRIGAVVTLISGIAEQTNLLALNATIEAARAGAAGRGFAVVASEVKALAEQTAKATDEISGQIAHIVSSTGQAVSSIAGISGRIHQINAMATSIAAAVEEQGAATQEIVRNVTQAAQGADEVTRNIAGVAVTADEAGQSANQVMAAASDLSRQSERMNAEVARFLATVRAA